MSLLGQGEQVMQIMCAVFSRLLNVFGMKRQSEQTDCRSAPPAG